MDITKADIAEFKELYATRFGLKLTDKMALIKLSMLVRQVELVYRPITKRQLEELDNGDEHVYRREPGNSCNL